MTVGIGLGLMEFPFAHARGYWRWVDLCEAGGVDSHLADRPVAEPRAACWNA